MGPVGPDPAALCRVYEAAMDDCEAAPNAHRAAVAIRAWEAFWKADPVMAGRVARTRARRLEGRRARL